MKRASLPLKVGIPLGLLFFGHAMVPNSNAWPLIWPLVAGAVVVILAARRGRLAHFWQGLGTAVGAGAAAGMLFFVATVISLWLLSLPALEAVARLFGAAGPLVLNPFTFVGLAAAALIGTALAALSGAATYPFAQRRPEHG